jgi:hypothetical protein
MRFIFKTRYDQDIALAKHGGHRFWYGAADAGAAHGAPGGWRATGWRSSPSS